MTTPAWFDLISELTSHGWHDAVIDEILVVADHSPDADERQMWESIYLGELDAG